MKANERLWLTADRKRLVPEGDPAAATLYAAPGHEVPDADAERFGLKDGRLKRRKGTEDKAAKGTEDKSAGGDKGGLKIKPRKK